MKENGQADILGYGHFPLFSLTSQGYGDVRHHDWKDALGLGEVLLEFLGL